MKRIVYTLFGWLCLLTLPACQDTFLPGGGEIPKGETTIRLTAQFKNMEPALTRADGQAIQSIESLYVLLYDAQGNLVKGYDSSSFTNYTDGSHSDADDCKTFGLSIPYGVYKMYAVANVDNFLTTYADDIQTETKLKEIKFDWNNATGQVGTNNQMFGYFVEGDDSTTPDNFQAPAITVNRSGMSFHAWVRRLASKVTVAFDASQLNENIFIYIKSVTIKDIAKECYLGQSNTSVIADKSNPTAEERATVLFPAGETLTTSTSTDYLQWPYVAHGKEKRYYYFGAAEADRGDIEDFAGLNEKAHTDVQPALFFYENMQGTGEVKVQEDNDNNGKPDDRNDANTDIQKDNKPYGTYVEVEAYYIDDNRPSNGTVYYRFMLGKDAQTDYNAERNYHYRLTLRFKNTAIDPDWHVEYDETLGIKVIPVYYVSYKYNQEFTMPVRAVGIDPNTEITAEIVENGWAPYIENNTDNFAYYKGPIRYPNVTEVKNYVEGQYYYGFKWNGFLSFVKPTTEILDDGSKRDVSTYSKDQWDAQNMGGPQGKIPVKDDEVNFNLYTRERKLVTTTGYSGANPYVGYSRRALIRLKASINGKIDSTDMEVIQVKRLVNPTGIYRSKDNTASFRVQLMEQEGVGGEFTRFESRGPWSAYVETGKDWVALNGTIGGEVKGSTGSYIEFDYAPSSTTADSRYGCIVVKYHNNSCIHKIFVIQGDDPVNMGDGTKWLASNLKTQTEQEPNPLGEGSYFKKNNWDMPIHAGNNIWSEYGEVIPWWESGNGLDIAGDHLGLVAWEDISYDTSVEFADPSRSDWTLPTKVQWDYLRSFEQATGVLYGNEAVGVQADPTEAYMYYSHLTDQNHQDYSPNIAKRGMRGTFVYNRNIPAVLFFPIGAAGHGKRKDSKAAEVSGDAEVGYAPDSYPASLLGGRRGLLRYASSNALFGETLSQYAPLLWYLCDDNGAIYWCKGDDSGHTAWDINYSNLDFNTYNTVATSAWNYTYNGTYYTNPQSDACLIRCVLKE